MKVLVGFKFHFGISLLKPTFIPSLYSEKKPLDRELHFRQAKLKDVRTIPGGKVPLIHA